ncbi:MAG TPA: hypothetical protein VFT47_18245 [Vicinamibacterales bacterium]|nr:hypothetical protein [Vicinamibacterales bacterium]
MNARRLDVFWRSRSNSLIHTWFTGANLDIQEDVEELRSEVALLSDPIAVSRAPDKIDVFARGVNQQLLHWWCDPRQEGMQGPRQVWWCTVFDPVAIADLVFDRVDLFARRTDGALRTIGMTGDDQLAPPDLLTSDDVWPSNDHAFGPAIGCTSQPALIRLPRSIAVLYRNAAGQIAWFTWNPNAHPGAVDLHPDEPIRGAIDAGASPYGAGFPHDPNRMDVYANDRGWLRHWGNGFLTNGWKGPEGSIGDRLDNVPIVIPSDVDSTDILARGDDRTLKNWHWRGPTLRWARVQLDDDVYSDPGAISMSQERDHIKVAAVDALGNLLLWTRRENQWPPSPTPIVASLTPKRKIALSDDDQFTLFASTPKVLIARPGDQALVGVDWVDCEPVDGTPPQLQAGTGSPILLITFPPQHVGEETHREEGARSSRSFLSDSSRLALALPRGGRIALTPDGVLDAIHGLSLVERGLLIEMPWGLSLSPKAGANGVVAQTVPATTERSAWKVALRPRDTADSLGIVATNARKNNDPFPLPLAKPDRDSVAQSTLRSPATAERIELNTLGGSLIAHGQWDNFEWDHRCLLGRDQAVRVLSKGVLYPLCHEAVFVEVTERALDPTASDPVAALRTRNVLIVTQPVRATADVTRAFPFSETEILTRRVEDVAYRWLQHELVPREIAELQETAAELTGRLPEIKSRIPGNGIPEDEVHHHPAAREYVDTLSAIEQIGNAISDLGQGDRADPVNLFFWPRVNERDPVQFDVRLQGSHGPIHVRMPLLFVMTWQLPRDHVHEAFDSLTDRAVALRLRDEYADHGAVETHGAIINLIQSSTAPTDVFEVEALHITGPSRGGGLHPRLGRERDSPAPEPPERSWAAKVSLPAARALLGKADDAVRRLAYSREYEQNAAADVALKLLDGLDLDFTKNTERSGGLMAPRMPTDAISRSIGLTAAAGRDIVSTDPAEFLSDGASLLGFDLRKLIGRGTAPPSVLTEMASGRLPAISMTWNDIPLQPVDAGPLRFEPSGATATLKVTTSPTRQEITATLGPSILHFPGSSPFISLSFKRISFTQIDGRPPSVDFVDPKPVFGNALRLFAKLLESVNLGNKGPKVEITSKGATVSYQVPVPDVTLISFNLTQLEFHSRLTLPFQGGAPTALIGFGTRNRPFALGVLMFTGAGHIEIGIGAGGATTFDVSLQFGALLAMNFVIGKAEVHAFGGIACQSQAGGTPAFTAFIHLGGSVMLLGAISVAFELSVELKFVPDENRLVGRAIVALHVGLFGYSQTFELDSGEWTICGDEPTPHLAPVPVAADAALESWIRYRSAFA